MLSADYKEESVHLIMKLEEQMRKIILRVLSLAIVIGIVSNSVLCQATEDACVNTARVVTTEDWNYHMIHSISALTENEPVKKVKVAVIDSGVNYSDDIDVYERKNFIAGEDDLSVLYEDFSGHGTSIAGIIAAKNNSEGITGINSNVELYSARVLDSNMKAPVSRVVKAIDWAIAKKVNIINLSFATNKDTKALKAAIDRAYDAGILMIASAGNADSIAYPAAYDSVMAVGSVNNHCEISKFSPVDNQAEITAPGELITSTDVFDTLSVHSGTSYAAAHVTGVASLLWQKDLHVTSDFVRCVLDLSANLCGESKEYGFGLVDYEYAKAVFQSLKALGKSNEIYQSLMCYGLEKGKFNNKRAIETYDKIDSVEGAWLSAGHEETVGDFEFTNAPDGREYLLAGCTLSDRTAITGLQGPRINPYLHGYWFYGNSTKYERNYFASYIYLTQIASALVHNEDVPAVPTLCKAGNTDSDKDNKDSLEYISPEGEKSPLINDTYVNARENIKWTDIEKIIQKRYAKNFDASNSVHKGLIVYGMAIHHAADLFAHSTVVSNNQSIGHRISHAEGADNKLVIKQRFAAAKQVVKNMLSHLDKEHVTKSGVASLSDFALADNYGKYFYVRKFRKFAEQICNAKEYKEIFSEKYLYLSDPWEDETKAGIKQKTFCLKLQKPFSD